MVQPYGYLENFSLNLAKMLLLRQAMCLVYDNTLQNFHSHRHVYILSPNINVREFVFVRWDTIKKSLQPNYEGPYKVL